MKVICLYGEPSAGKTSTMYLLAGKMKKMGLSVEIASEYYKEKVYENTHPGNDFATIVENTKNQVARFGGQLSILSEQNKRLSRLSGTVDFVITDCPLPLIAYYTPKDYIDGFENFVMNLFNSYDNINFFLKRNHEFEDKARIHNEEQALAISKELPLYLEKFIGKNVKEMFTSDFIEDEIISCLIEQNIIKTPKKKALFKK